MGEPAAPSSSPLWPLLLAPWSRLPLQAFELVPLVINALCVMATLALIKRHLNSLGDRAATLLALVLNLYGLVFTGLEHSLQVLLVTAIAVRVASWERKGCPAEGPNSWVWLSLLVLPLVRYEGLAITVPVEVWLLSRGQARPALLTLVASALLLAAFTAFLRGQGLGLLPSSILSKSTDTGVKAVVFNLKKNLQAYGWVPLLVLGCGFHVPEMPRGRTLMLLGVCALLLTYGHFGAYGRYEVYFLLFVALMLLDVLLQRWPLAWRVLAALPVAVSSLLNATLTTPLAAQNLYSQQVQMADLVHHLDMPVAVNDLGLVSLREGQYVLDLYGLGSVEALHARRQSPDSDQWAADMMARKGVAVVLVYDKWFPHRPAGWIKVGELLMNMSNITLGDADVAVYAMNPAVASRVASALPQAWSAHPGGRFVMRDEQQVRLAHQSGRSDVN